MTAQLSDETHGDWVPVKEDSQSLIKELSDMLLERGVESRIALAPGCQAGTCSCRFHLLVHKNDSQAALENIDEYYMELHPEMRDSHEWAAQDKCPACGFDVEENAKECADCGITLIVD